MLLQREIQVMNKKKKLIIFKWITNFKIIKKNAVKLALSARPYWKIENQGFNRQKHQQGNLEHVCLLYKYFYQKKQFNSELIVAKEMMFAKR